MNRWGSPHVFPESVSMKLIVLNCDAGILPVLAMLGF